MYEFRQSPFNNDPEDLELIVEGVHAGRCWKDADGWMREGAPNRYLIYWNVGKLSGFAYYLESAKAIMLALAGVEERNE
jgi:hypothetical protein